MGGSGSGGGGRKERGGEMKRPGVPVDGGALRQRGREALSLEVSRALWAC